MPSSVMTCLIYCAIKYYSVLITHANFAKTPFSNLCLCFAYKDLA